MIKKAAEFARIAHEGEYRKGSRIPYIYHPMEVALLVAGMTRDRPVFRRSTRKVPTFSFSYLIPLFP